MQGKVGDILGTIFDIQRFSVHDGPGIRTTVFLKGCPLRCRWCANPEGLFRRQQLMFREQRCRGCGRCAESCKQQAIGSTPAVGLNREGCDLCGACVEACLNSALVLVGREVSARHVLDEVMKDEPFYRNSGGGVTLSGGEPTLQPGFASAVLELCKGAGLHTAVETCGFTDWPNLEALARHTDLFLFDLKTIDEKLHRRLTGQSNKGILGNARRLVSSGAEVQFRMPLVPGCNDDRGNIQSTAAFLKEVKRPSIVILPYHRLGEEKYTSIGLERPQSYEATTQALLDKVAGLFKGNGIEAIVY